VCRTVSRGEGEGLAARLDCAYFETSAAEDLSSVTTAFGRVLGDVLRLRDRQPTLQVVARVVVLVVLLALSLCLVHTLGTRLKSKDEGKWIYIAPYCSTPQSRRSGMDHTVLPANYTIIPVFTS